MPVLPNCVPDPGSPDALSPTSPPYRRRPHSLLSKQEQQALLLKWQKQKVLANALREQMREREQVRQAELAAKQAAQAEERQRLGLSPVPRLAASASVPAEEMVLEPIESPSYQFLKPAGTGSGSADVSPTEAESIRQWLVHEVGGVKKEVQAEIRGIQKGQAELAEELRRLSPDSRAAVLAKVNQANCAETDVNKSGGGFGDLLHESNMRLRQVVVKQEATSPALAYSPPQDHYSPPRSPRNSYRRGTFSSHRTISPEEAEALQRKRAVQRQTADALAEQIRSAEQRKAAAATAARPDSPEHKSGWPPLSVEGTHSALAATVEDELGTGGRRRHLPSPPSTSHSCDPLAPSSIQSPSPRASTMPAATSAASGNGNVEEQLRQISARLEAVEASTSRPASSLPSSDDVDLDEELVDNELHGSEFDAGDGHTSDADGETEDTQNATPMEENVPLLAIQALNQRLAAVQAEVARATMESEKRWAAFGLGTRPPDGQVVATMTDLEAIAADLLITSNIGSTRPTINSSEVHEPIFLDSAMENLLVPEKKTKKAQEPIIVMVDIEATDDVASSRAGQTYLVELMLADTIDFLHRLVAEKVGHPMDRTELWFNSAKLSRDCDRSVGPQGAPSASSQTIANIGVRCGDTLSAMLR